MVNKQDFVRVSPYIFEIPKDMRADMRVPARIYADDRLLDAVLQDRSIEQLINTATLPGVVKYALAMPDVHQGYGFPIGGVAATALPDGIISPGGVGYDINCGVRVLTTSIQVDELRPHLDSLMTALFRNIGTGVGASGQLRLSVSEMHELLEGGSEWVIKRGYGRREDLAYTEDGGRMPDARAEAVSPRAIERGQNQVGTLGSGNHFLELDEVVEIFDHEAAQAFGLIEGTVTVWIHCGSRGLGHQVCTDAVREMQQSVRKYGIEIPDRELVCSPFSSPEGQRYFQAMSAAANYAWANRQVITHHVRQTFEEVLAGKLPRPDLRLLYDVCHNIAKVERHKINGEEREVCVHRKGATRTFGPGLPQVPEDYRQIGQPVLIPGSMGVGSYILVGTEGAMEQTFGSSCHGAGRMWSRSKALREVQGSKLRAELEKENILVRAGSMRGLAEEAPDAYKDVDAVVDVVHNTGIARRVARTRPIGVIKG